jgi:hypothetical protein
MTCSCSAFKKPNLILTDEERKIENEKKTKTVERYIDMSVGSTGFWTLIIILVMIIAALILYFLCKNK